MILQYLCKMQQRFVTRHYIIRGYHNTCTIRLYIHREYHNNGRSRRSMLKGSGGSRIVLRRNLFSPVDNFNFSSQCIQSKKKFGGAPWVQRRQEGLEPLQTHRWLRPYLKDIPTLVKVIAIYLGYRNDSLSHCYMRKGYSNVSTSCLYILRGYHNIISNHCYMLKGNPNAIRGIAISFQDIATLFCVVPI